MCQNLRSRFKRDTGLDYIDNQTQYLSWLENLESSKQKDLSDIDKANMDITKINHEDDIRK